MQDHLNSSDRPLDITLTGLPVADGYAHASLAAPGRSAEKGFSRALNRRDHVIGATVMSEIGRARRVISKAHQALIDLGFPEDVHPVEGSNLPDQCLCPLTGALNQGGHAPATEMTYRCVGGNSPPPARPFWVPIGRFAHLGVAYGVGGRIGHGAAVCLLVGDEDITSVIRHV